MSSHFSAPGAKTLASRVLLVAFGFDDDFATTQTLFEPFAAQVRVTFLLFTVAILVSPSVLQLLPTEASALTVGNSAKTKQHSQSANFNRGLRIVGL
jgi:hypothetical protein